MEKKEKKTSLAASDKCNIFTVQISMRAQTRNQIFFKTRRLYESHLVILEPRSRFIVAHHKTATLMSRSHSLSCLLPRPDKIHVYL